MYDSQEKLAAIFSKSNSRTAWVALTDCLFFLALALAAIALLFLWLSLSVVVYPPAAIKKWFTRISDRWGSRCPL